MCPTAKVKNAQDTNVTAVTVDPDRQNLMKLCKDHEGICQNFEKALNDWIRTLGVKKDIAKAKLTGSIFSGWGRAATLGVACAGPETLGASLAVAPFTIGLTLCGAATKAGATVVGCFRTSVVEASANYAEALEKFLESHGKLCAALEVSDFKAEHKQLVACASWTQHAYVPAAAKPVPDDIKCLSSQVVGEPAAQVAEGVADLLPEVALESFAILGVGVAIRSVAKSYKEYKDTKKIKVSISALDEQQRREEYFEALQKLMKTLGDKERTVAIGLA